MAILATGSNTFSALLVNNGVSIPSLQNMFIYTLLILVYTPITLYKYGFAKYRKLILQDDRWKCMLVLECIGQIANAIFLDIILAFLDVEGVRNVLFPSHSPNWFTTFFNRIILGP